MEELKEMVLKGACFDMETLQKDHIDIYAGAFTRIAHRQSHGLRLIKLCLDSE